MLSTKNVADHDCEMTEETLVPQAGPSQYPLGQQQVSLQPSRQSLIVYFDHRPRDEVQCPVAMKGQAIV
jgi:hypothetical protein